MWSFHRDNKMVFESKYPKVSPDEKYKDLVSNFFWLQLDEFHDRTLFVDHETQRKWTGAQIKTTSARIAKGLIKYGLRPGDDCVLFYKHCDYIQLTALGVLFAGGSNCAGYPLDPENEHEYMLEAMLPRFVFVTRSLVPQMARLRMKNKRNYTIVVMDDDDDDDDDDALTSGEWNELKLTEDAFAKQSRQPIVVGLHHDLLADHSDFQPDTPLPVQVEPTRPAFVIMTSGSTGRPKPASRSQRNSLYVCHSFLGKPGEELWDLSGSSVVAAHLALDHGTGIFLLKQCLAHGYTSIIIDGFQNDTMLEAIERYGVTELVLGSALVQNMLTSDRLASLSPDELRKRYGSLRNLLAVGSTIASQTTVSNFMRTLGDCSVRQAYGATECGFLAVVPRQMAIRQAAELAPEVVGAVLPNVELKLMLSGPVSEGHQRGIATCETASRQEVVELGQRAEMYVRGPTISSGYVGEHFRDSASANFQADGFYKTGDICSVGADGLLRAHGRQGDVLCLGDGWKVLPSEIEQELLEHPFVAEAAVVGIPHPELPTCHAPRAYVVPRPGVKIVDSDGDGDGDDQHNHDHDHGQQQQRRGATQVLTTNDNNNINQSAPTATGEPLPGADRDAQNFISRKIIYDFVAGRLSGPKHLVGGIKFVRELPKISIGKVDKRSLKLADGY